MPRARVLDLRWFDPQTLRRLINVVEDRPSSD
jgi:hypothetical protein